MAAPGRSGPARPTLILLVLSTITLLTLDFRSFGPLEAVQGAVRTVVDPFADAAGSVFSPLTNGWQGLTQYDDVVAENAELRTELDQLRGEAVRGQAAEATLGQLLSELDIEFLQGVDTVVGRVGDRIGNFDNFAIDINRGSADGIEVGMPAATSAGLVGRVTSVDTDQARVELITESDFGVGVRIIGTGDIALAKGQGRGRELIVEQGIDDNSQIDTGMAVVTSGIEGSPFPPDIGVGTVSSVSVGAADLRQQLTITPLADLDRLSFITIILWNLES